VALDPVTGLLAEIPFELLSSAPGRGAPIAIAAVPEEEAARLERSGVQASDALAGALRGEALRDAGRLEEAEQAYRDALEADPGCETAHEGLLGILLGRMASDLSTDPPRQAVEEAMEKLSAALPGRAVVHRFEGRVRRLLGQHRKALGRLRKAEAADPEDIHTLCELASCHVTTGAAEEAPALLHRALEIAPAHPRPNLELADHHAGQGDFAAAEHYVRCALDLDPGSAYGHEVLAMVHRSRDEHEQALASLEKAASLGSDTDWVHLERATNLMELERWQEARGSLEIVVERDGTSAEARARYVEVLSRLGEGARAVEEARFLLSVDPGAASSQELLGLALETDGKTSEAEQAYARALELSQEHMPARRRLDALLGRQERHDERVGLWLVAVRRDPADPELMSGLASALEADGKKEEAGLVGRRAAISGGGPALERLEALRAECAQSADPRAVLDAAAREWDEAVVYAELGRLCLMTSEPDAAEVWKRVVEIEPSDPVAVAMLAHALRLEDRRRVEMEEARVPGALGQAAEALDHVLEMEPYWIWARAERGLVALAMNVPQDAIDVLEPVTEDAPAAWEVRLSAYARLGQHDLAARAGDRLIATSSPRPADLVRIAREHAAAGDAERASEVAEMAAAALPPGPSALRTQAESLIR
jgi:tetratricopeptide (TPR) repeat protein